MMRSSLLGSNQLATIALASAQCAGNQDWNRYYVRHQAIFEDPNRLTISLCKGNTVMWENTFDRLEVCAMTVDEFTAMLRDRWPLVFRETDEKRKAREAEEAKTVNRVRSLAESIAHDLDGICSRIGELKTMLGELK